MNKTALELSPEEWKKYVLPQRTVKPEVKAHWEKAWNLIPKLVRQLREEFGATKVKVFGSAIKIEYFSMESDIDLAAWNIPPTRYFTAALAVSEFDPDFEVDLVDPTLCSPKLLKKIEEEGIDV